MNYNNLLWNKIEQGIKEKAANHLLDCARKEYEELIKNNLCEKFYTASEIVEFMRARDIPFSCRGRLPALSISYLLNFIPFNPLTFELKAEYFFDSLTSIGFDVSEKRKDEIEDFLHQAFHNKVSKIALQNEKDKCFMHACNYLFDQDVYGKYPPMHIDGKNCVYVSSLKWLETQKSGFVIALLKMNMLDEIQKHEIQNGVTENTYGLYEDKKVFERIRDKNNDYFYFTRYERDKFNKQKENSIKALAYALMTEVDDKYLSHYICYAILIYKQAYF